MEQPPPLTLNMTLCVSSRNSIAQTLLAILGTVGFIVTEKSF